MKEVIVHGRTFELYLTAQEIQKSIESLAAQLKSDFRGRNPLFVCIMNGAFMFAAELMSGIDEDFEVAFARYSTYDGLESTSKLNEVMPVTNDLTDRVVIIVEDLIDTGFTMKCVKERFLELGAREVYVVALFSKPEAHTPDLEADYVALNIENKFILGHGLDYDNYGRMFRDLYKLKD